MSSDVALGQYTQVPSSEPYPEHNEPLSPRFLQGQRVSQMGADEITFSSPMLWRSAAAAVAIFSTFLLWITGNQLYLIGTAAGILVAMFFPNPAPANSSTQRIDELYGRVLESAEPLPPGSCHHGYHV